MNNTEKRNGLSFLWSLPGGLEKAEELKKMVISHLRDELTNLEKSALRLMAEKKNSNHAEIDELLAVIRLKRWDIVHGSPKDASKTIDEVRRRIQGMSQTDPFGR